MSLHTHFHLLLSILLLQAFSMQPARADLSELPTNSQACIQQGFYDCSVCSCDITNPDTVLNIILCVISLIFSLFMIVGFITVKELRAKPGDLIFALAIADVFFAVGRIMGTLTHLDNDVFDDNDSTPCTAASVINIIAIGMTYSYNIAFFVYYMSILRTSLKGGGLPDSLYHLLPITATSLFTLILLAEGYVGRSIYGVCEIRTAPGIVLPIVFNILLLVIVYIFAHFTRRYIPRSGTISSLKTKFLNFYLKYLIAISIIYIAKGVMDTITGLMLDDILDTEVDGALVKNLNAIKVIMDILNGLTPVILTLGRVADPMIQQHWKKILRIKTEEPSNLTDSLQRGSIDVRDLQISLEMQSHVQQFQHSRRVGVLYSLLSGIHYFWNVKKMNKLIELEPLKFSPAEDDPNEDFIKESKNKRTLFVQEETLTKQVPELFAEIQDKQYSLADGTLTAYAPRLFEEIIELDDVGRGIRNSLDLKLNFTRILKSGVNGGGKSGEFFFFSADNKFIIKTVSDTELEVFREILPSYVKYLKLNPNSAIAKIYGIFKFEIAEPYESYNLILMKNINGFPSQCVDRKYDLKGSTVGRIAIRNLNVSVDELKNYGVLKDLDFDKFEKKVNAAPAFKRELFEILKKDIQFLSSMNLVDYSLALYVIDRKKRFESKDSIASNATEMSDGPKLSFGANGEVIRLPPARSSFSNNDTFTAFKSSTEDKYYHIGIIDYLIQYGLKKRSEVFFKKLGALNPNLDISVQHPRYYGERFIKYMEKIILD